MQQKLVSIALSDLPHLLACLVQKTITALEGVRTCFCAQLLLASTVRVQLHCYRGSHALSGTTVLEAALAFHHALLVLVITVAVEAPTPRELHVRRVSCVPAQSMIRSRAVLIHCPATTALEVQLVQLCVPLVTTASGAVRTRRFAQQHLAFFVLLGLYGPPEFFVLQATTVQGVARTKYHVLLWLESTAPLDQH